MTNAKRLDRKAKIAPTNANGSTRRAAARAPAKTRLKRLMSSVLLQSTALAGTLAGVPLPYYGRGFYSRAYAQTTCSPSSTDNDINDGSAISSTTFSCTTASNDTVTTPQYVYGGSYTFYQNLQEQQFYTYHPDTGNYYYYTYHRANYGQPGLNIKITNTADITVGQSASTQSAIATTTSSNYLYRQASTQSNALSVVSLGGNSWAGGYGGSDGYSVQNDGGGGAGGDITITSSGTLKSTVGGGIYAQSRAGDGVGAYRGGAGGAVNIKVTGDVSGATSGVVAISQGGVSSGPVPGYETQAKAGSGGDVSVAVYSSVSATGSGPAILAASYGGNSPRAQSVFFSYPPVRDYLLSNDPWEGGIQAGEGGTGGTVELTLGSSSDAFGGTISTSEPGAVSDGGLTRKTGAAVAASSIGGQGLPVYAAGNDEYVYYSGGDGGDVSISANTNSNAKIQTSGDDSPGVLAQSAGGQSISGYQQYDFNGGDGNSVNVDLKGSGSIITSGDRASGIVAQSLGGAGQSNLNNTTYGNAGRGGQVKVTNSLTISTSGGGSHGIVAQSAAAAFGYGNYTYDGNGDFVWGDLNTSSIGSDDVSVTNTGAITTTGVDAHGIVAQSIGGGGGVLNSTDTLSTGSNGGVDADNRQTLGGGAGHAGGGAVSVNNSGDITTTGGSSASTTSEGVVLSGGIAILAQSIGGGGGVNGGNGAIGAIGGGGTGTAGSDGGTVSVQNDATLSTSGAEAHGIVAQSIGGGGGSGRNGYGLFFSVGGTGGAGGDGGEISITNGGTIETSGDYAAGVIAQSIGGGGGQGGSATSWGLLFSSSVGGSGGQGGDGGAVTFEKNYSSVITTTGGHAPSIVLQSIGGGGGTGGAAKSYTGGLELGISVATGGSGGDGGHGGEVTAHVAGTLKTEGTDSTGVIVQSIGGGGGQGGAATADALTVGIPIDTDLNSFALSVTVAHGGTGGSGGDGGEAQGFVDPNSSIATDGDSATGLIVQSIGGGGGQGGDATAAAGSLSLQSLVSTISENTAEISGKNVSLNLDVSLGGLGGDGGHGGTAYSHVLGAVTTSGNFSRGVLVQSIGGGGGEGGTGESDSITTFGESTFTLGVTIGGSAGQGGDGGEARGGLHSTGVVKTSGHNASALVVQSIGGGGGVGGSGSGDLDAETTLNIGVGATGGAGGHGGTVYAWNAGKITTSGDASSGLIAQSIGGGGGIGGSGTSSVSHSFEIEKEIDKEEQDGIEIADKVGVDLDFKGTATVGASGGTGGDGGTVYVGIAKVGDDKAGGSINTTGVFSHGILAQSIGGGGGQGGVSSNKSELNTVFDGVDTNIAVLNVGGASGSSGDGGDVHVYAANVETTGFGSHGVVAQSIGGGGGQAISSGYAVDTATVSLGGDATGNGGTVYVGTLSGTDISVHEQYSNGILAQSIGGGGGLASVALGDKQQAGDTNSDASINLTLGSGDGSGSAGDVTVVHSGDIWATGGANGIVAQSISAGGGFLAATAAQKIANISFPKTVSGSTDGSIVSVTTTSTGTIDVLSDGGVGILAQWIRGGGGAAANFTYALTPYYAGFDGSSNPYSYVGLSSADNPSAVNVTVDANSKITVGGNNAHGIIAQAIAGGGGIFTRNGKTYAGSLGRFQGLPVLNNLTGASVDITVSGVVASITQDTKPSPTSWAIWAQAIGPVLSIENIPVGNTITINVNKDADVQGTTEQGDDGRHNGGAIYTSASPGITVSVNNSGVVYGNIVHQTFTAQTQSATRFADGAVDMSATPKLGESVFLNQGSGTFITGAIVDSDRTLNAGTLNVGGAGNTATTVFSGDLAGLGTRTFGSAHDAAENGLEQTFTPTTYYSGSEKKVWRTATQSKGGLITGLDVDMGAGTNDRLIVRGDFAGTWGAILNPTSLLPNQRTDLIRIDGADLSDFSVLPTLVFSFTEPTTSNGWKGISVDSANFADTGIALGGNAQGVAEGLQSAWDRLADGSASTVELAAEEIAFDEVFAVFHAVTPETLEDTLRPLSSQTSLAPLALAPQTAIATANSVLSCPAFTTGTSLQEGECVWGRAFGARTQQERTSGSAGFDQSTMGFQTGGQKTLGDGWFIGGSLTYEDSRFQGDTGRSWLDAESLAGALALKKEVGPWLFGLAGGAGYSWGTSTRDITLGTLSARATGSPKSAFGFGRARASYQIAFDERFYMRPMVDLDAIAVHQRGYTESGAGALNLVVDSATDTVFGVTPAVEFGARLDMPGQRPARLFAGGGVSFLSSDRWDSTARFAGLTTMDPFVTSMPIADTIGHISAGIDIQSNIGLELKFQYDGALADGYQSHTGSFRLGYRF